MYITNTRRSFKNNKLNNGKTKKEYPGNAPPTDREETEQVNFLLLTGV